MSQETATIYQPDIIYRSCGLLFSVRSGLSVVRRGHSQLEIRDMNRSSSVGEWERAAGLPDRNIILFDVELIPGYICY